MPERSHRPLRARTLLAVGAIALLVSSCAQTDPSVTAMTSATPVIVTFEVGDDEGFKVLLTQPDDIANARQVLAGVDVPSIPDGRIVRERGVNGPWSWSLDPGDFTFTDVTDETCDGLPSEIETGSVSGERYCPWSAQVIVIDPAPLTPPTSSAPLTPPTPPTSSPPSQPPSPRPSPLS